MFSPPSPGPKSLARRRAHAVQRPCGNVLLPGLPAGLTRGEPVQPGDMLERAEHALATRNGLPADAEVLVHHEDVVGPEPEAGGNLAEPILLGRGRHMVAVAGADRAASCTSGRGGSSPTALRRTPHKPTRRGNRGNVDPPPTQRSPAMKRRASMVGRERWMANSTDS